MADPQQPFFLYLTKTPANTQQPVDQQVTSKTPATKQKNPRRVAAGKAIAEKRRIALDAQRKTLIEAQSIIAQAKLQDYPVADTPSSEPETTKNVLTTTQLLSITSILVSLIGLYYKSKEIKSVLTKKADPQSPVLPRAPPPSPVDAAPKRNIRQMD